jgi:hypothetical protein
MFVMRRPSRHKKRPLRRKARIRVEQLEERCLLAYSPLQMQHAYGFDQVMFNGGTVKGDGSGQTIAIVDAFSNRDSNGNDLSLSDLQAFDANFKLPDPPSFRVVYTQGTQQVTTPPPVDTGWALEMDLDIEWAHAIAPNANIILVNTADNSYTNLLGGDTWAANNGAVVVSNSWGGSEFAGETANDSTFLGHPGVSFVFSSGDGGKPGEYPAYSPNVIAVGGTTLNLDSAGNWLSETGWGNGNLSQFLGGSGGGISKYEKKPSYQKNVKQSSTKRTNPDVAYDADPNTGVAVYGQLNGGWQQVGGTSAGAPQWSALLSIVDQGRTYNTNGQTGSLGTADVLSRLYSVSPTDFHDITKGNNGYAASRGYDLVTGLGSPIAQNLIPDLVATVSTGASAHGTTTQLGNKKAKNNLVVDQQQNPVTPPANTANLFASDPARNFQALFTAPTPFQAPTFQAPVTPVAAAAATTTIAPSTSVNMGTAISGASDGLSDGLSGTEDLKVMPVPTQENKIAPGAPVVPVTPMVSTPDQEAMNQSAVDSYFIAASITVKSESVPTVLPATVSEQQPLEVVPVANAAGLVAFLGGFWTLQSSQEDERNRRQARR